MEKESKFNILLTSFLSLVLGIILIVATEELLISVNYVLVCIFLITGVIQVITFFLNKSYKEGNYNSLLLGTVLMWLSLFVYIYYNMLVVTLPIILSLYSVIMGVVLLIRYFNLKSVLKVKYKRYLIMSLFSFVISVLLIVKPMLSVFVYFQMAGVYVIFLSFLYFFEFWAYFKKNKETKKLDLSKD